MLILEIILSHFGKFQDRKIQFQPGINLIYGDNEAGKTTVHSFIRGMILGIEKNRGRESRDDLYTRFLPWSTPTLYGGSMKIWCQDREYLVERSFYKEDKYHQVTDLLTGRTKVYETWQTAPQFGKVTKGSYRNTISMEQSKISTDGDLEVEMKNYMANLTTSRSNKVDINKALQTLMDKKKELKSQELMNRIGTLENRLESAPVLERQRTVLEDKIKQLQMEEVIKEKHNLEKPNSQNFNAQIQTTQNGDKKNYNYRDGKNHNKGIQRIFYTGISIVTILVLFFLGEVFDIQEWSYIGTILVGVIGVMVWKRTKKQSSLPDEKIEEPMENQITATPKENVNHLLQIERLGWELEQVEEKLGQLEMSQEELKDLVKQRENNMEEIAAIDLAMQTISRLSQEIHDGFGNQFNTKVSLLTSQITNHTYNKVYVDEKLNMKVVSGNTLIPIKQLSAGTQDQVFMAQRLAAGELLLGQEDMPIILDDSLVLYDDNRCRSTLNMLARMEKQVLLFTCQKREMELLDQMKMKYNLIEL